MNDIDRLLAAHPGARVLATRLPGPPEPSSPILRDRSRGGWLVCRFAVGGRPAAWCTFGVRDTDKAARRQRLAEWKDSVARAAADAMGDRGPVAGPVEVWINFVFPPGEKPGDRDNLCKGTTDSLEGIAFRNDDQVVGGEVRRVTGPIEGAVVEVWAVEEPIA